MLKKKKKKKQIQRDPEKERVYKGLVEKLRKKGLTVRREKLKQGFGWKVMSGSCTLDAEAIIFVDSRMSQDDQIAFLTGKLQEVNAPEAA